MIRFFAFVEGLGISGSKLFPTFCMHLTFSFLKKEVTVEVSGFNKGIWEICDDLGVQEIILKSPLEIFSIKVCI